MVPDAGQIFPITAECAHLSSPGAGNTMLLIRKYVGLGNETHSNFQQIQAAVMVSANPAL